MWIHAAAPMASDRIIRWMLLLEEFGPEYHHIKGEDNVVANALSRIHCETEEVTAADATRIAHCMCTLTREETVEMPNAANISGMATCFAGSEDVAFEGFPMKPALIAREQAKDKKIQKNLQNNWREFQLRKVEGSDLLSYQGKIVIPDSLQGRIIAWYHKYLAHPGITHMEATIHTFFVWPGMRQQ